MEHLFSFFKSLILFVINLVSLYRFFFFPKHRYCFSSFIFYNYRRKQFVRFCFLVFLFVRFFIYLEQPLLSKMHLFENLIWQNVNYFNGIFIRFRFNITKNHKSYCKFNCKSIRFHTDMGIRFEMKFISFLISNLII